MPRKPHPSRKTFTRFSSRLPFQFGLPNVSPSLGQASDDSPIYFTRATSLLRQQVLAKASGVKIKSDSYRMQVVPRDSWHELPLAKKSILFLIPDDALGDCVGMTLFLRALRLRFPDVSIGVLNSGSASDIFGLIPDIKIFQLFMSSKQFAHFDHVIDLSEMEGWRNISKKPVNTEETLCKAFRIEPVPLSSQGRNLVNSSTVGIVPLASAPIRTLPPELVRSIIKHLSTLGFEVSVLLNRYQGISTAYKAALKLSEFPAVKILDGSPTVAGLLNFVKSQNYIVVADSGPAHISKLFQTPGLAIYTSASGQTLQGRHDNLKIWQSRYSGPFCEAPCGIAKLRATADGQVGCMGSLMLPLESLPMLPSSGEKGLAEYFTLSNPVPCVKHLLSEHENILLFLTSDLLGK